MGMLVVIVMVIMIMRVPMSMMMVAMMMMVMVFAMSIIRYFLDGNGSAGVATAGGTHKMIFLKWIE